MTQESVRKTYRELAEAFGLTVDAARMKAKRAEKAGRWRIIEGNHPSDTKMVELPADDLNRNKRIGRDERAKRMLAKDPYDDTPTHDDTVGAIVVALEAALKRVEELTNQLTTEKDDHKDTAIRLAQSEAHQSLAALELAQLQSAVDRLTTELAVERRSWWQRLTRK